MVVHNRQTRLATYVGRCVGMYMQVGRYVGRCVGFVGVGRYMYIILAHLTKGVVGVG